MKFLLFAFALILMANDVHSELCKNEYTIQSGDTVFRIAKNHNVLVDDILENNKIQDPSNIRVGQKIIILSECKPKAEVQTSSKEGTQSNPSNVQPESQIQNQEASQHIVQKGDTLYNISRRYGMKVDDIKSMNNMADNNIKLGQVLKLKGVVVVAPQKEEIKPAEPVVQDLSIDDNESHEDKLLSEIEFPVQNGNVLSANINGIFIASKENRPHIKAAYNGVVIFAKKLQDNDSVNRKGDNVVVIKHEVDGIKYLSSYGNVSDLVIKENDKVLKGQIIGYGNKGFFDANYKMFFALVGNNDVINGQKIKSALERK